MVRATIDGIPARNRRSRASRTTGSSGSSARISAREAEKRRIEAARHQALLDERQRARARRALASRQRVQAPITSRSTQLLSSQSPTRTQLVRPPYQSPQRLPRRVSKKTPQKSPQTLAQRQQALRRLDQAKLDQARREASRQSATEDFLQPVESLSAAVRRKVAERSAETVSPTMVARNKSRPKPSSVSKPSTRETSLGRASIRAKREDDLATLITDSTDDFLEEKYDEDFWDTLREKREANKLKNATEFGTSRGRIEIGVPDSDLEKPKKPQKPQKPKKKKKITKQRVILFSLLGIFIAAAAASLIWGQDLIAKISSGRATIFDALGAAFSQDVQLKTGKNNRTNVLVLGTSGYEMSGSGHDGAQLTDSIMLLSFDQNTKDLAMLNIPRDFYVGSTCMGIGKINELYWCANQEDNNESAGVSALSSQVETITGIDSQYYVHVDWGALVQIVDSLGGITVTLDEDINDQMTNTYIRAGVATTLNGEQALGLARARHGTDNGDFSRGNSQQKILIALQQRLASGDITMTQGISLINTLGDNLRTDLSMNELSTVFHLATGMDLSLMRSVPLIDVNGTYYVDTTNMDNNGVDVSYVIPSAGMNNYFEIKKYITRQFSSEPSVREEAKILILNGAGISGLAASERDALVSTGYLNIDIDDAPDGIYPDRYYIYDISGNKSGTISALSKRYSVTALSADVLPGGINAKNYDIVIILGTQPESESTSSRTESNYVNSPPSGLIQDSQEFNYAE